MSAYTEQISDGIMEGEKTLCVPGRFESAHLPFPLARRLMRGFDAIVGVPLHTADEIPGQQFTGSEMRSIARTDYPPRIP